MIRAVRRSPSHSPPFPLITFAPQAGVRAETERYAITERGRRQRDEESGESEVDRPSLPSLRLRLGLGSLGTT